MVPISGQGMLGLSIASTSVQEAWRPTLQRVRRANVAAGWRQQGLPSRGCCPRGGAADKAAAAAVLAVIPVPMAEVTLVAPSPAVAVEETRESELPISPGGGTHGLSLPSEPKASEESVAMMELGRPVVSNANEVVEIPSDDEADLAARPPVSPRELMVSPRGPAVV